MRKPSIYYVSLIAIVGIGMSIVVGFYVGNFNHDTPLDYRKDSIVYNQTALYLLDRGEFHGPDSEVVGTFRRAPGYPLFLAGLYGLFRRSPSIVWFAQGIIFLIALILLWRISLRVLPGNWAFAPPLFLSLAWFVVHYVTLVRVEILALFLILSGTLLLFKVFESQKLKHAIYYAISGGVVFGYAALVLPVTLYFIPLGVIMTPLFLRTDWATVRKKLLVSFFIVVSALVVLQIAQYIFLSNISPGIHPSRRAEAVDEVLADNPNSAIWFVNDPITSALVPSGRKYHFLKTGKFTHIGVHPLDMPVQELPAFIMGIKEETDKHKLILSQYYVKGKLSDGAVIYRHR